MGRGGQSGAGGFNGGSGVTGGNNWRKMKARVISKRPVHQYNRGVNVARAGGGKPIPRRRSRFTNITSSSSSSGSLSPSLETLSMEELSEVEGEWRSWSEGSSTEEEDEEIEDHGTSGNTGGHVENAGSYLMQALGLRQFEFREKESRGKRGRPGHIEDEKSWRLTTRVDGGPENPELLTGFLGHVACNIWHGQERGVLIGRSGFDLLNSCSVRRRKALDLIGGSGLGHLKFCMYEHINMPLISAFVERWHPETNSFHLPFGEMTITIHDVYYLLRIPVEGDVVRPTPEMLSQLEGIDGHRATLMWARNGGNVNLKTLQKSMSNPRIKAEEVATWYLSWLVGATLFLHESEDSMSFHYPLMFMDVPACGKIAWGTGALAYLYRQLGIASRNDCRHIAGCLTLLQAWIFEYFPGTRPKKWLDWNPSLPYACRWIPTKVQPLDDKLKAYRRALDRCTDKDVNWTPYGTTPGKCIPISLFRGIIHCQSITEPYMPDRVRRQFGYPQSVPRAPLIPQRVHMSANSKKYVREHPANYSFFKMWKLHTCDLRAWPNRQMEGEVDESYLRWFLERTHPQVSKGAQVTQQQLIPPQAIDPATRLQLLGAYMYLLHPEVRRRTSQQEIWATIDEVCVHLEDWMPLLPESRRRGKRQRGSRQGGF